jgi:hypothetical protein
VLASSASDAVVDVDDAGADVNCDAIVPSAEPTSESRDLRLKSMLGI